MDRLAGVTGLPTGLRGDREHPWRASGGIVALAVVTLLSGCTSGPLDTVSSPTPRPIPTGAFAPLPPPATSYAGLGGFGRYAQALDREYGTKPDFADWDAEADYNCSSLQTGDTESMAEPSAFLGEADDTVTQGDGEIHPIAGKVWAASVAARCPGLLTPATRELLETEEVAGLRWVSGQR